MGNVAPQVEAPKGAKQVRGHAPMHLLMLVATVCWAGNIVAGKHALREVGTLPLVQVRVLGAALLFAVLFFGWRRRPSIVWNREHVRRMLLLALCGVTLNQLCFLGGLARTSVAHTGLIVALTPVMVLILACAMRLEAFTLLKFVGMLVSFGGLAVLTYAKVGQGNGEHWVGDVILLASSVVFAYYTILVKEVSGRWDSLTLNTLTYGLGAALLVPFGARAVFHVPWGALPGRTLWAIAYMVVLGSVVPYLLYAISLAELSPSRVAAFGYIQPVVATALGIWMLHEKLTLRTLVGGALILLGVYLTERERGEERRVSGSPQGTAQESV